MLKMAMVQLLTGKVGKSGYRLFTMTESAAGTGRRERRFSMVKGVGEPCPYSFIKG